MWSDHIVRARKPRDQGQCANIFSIPSTSSSPRSTRIGRGELDVRCAIGLAALEMRTALDEWARRADCGEDAHLPRLHRDVEKLLGAAASG